MWCPVCGAEYQPQFTRCSDCDVDLISARPEQPDVLFRAIGTQLASELDRYERRGGRDPIRDVVEHGEWSEWFSPTESKIGAPRPDGRWEIVLRRDGQRVVVVGFPNGGWWAATPKSGSWTPGVSEWQQAQSKGLSSPTDQLLEALRGVPLLLWILIVAVLLGTGIWLGMRSEPAQLRWLAWLDVVVVSLVVVCVVPASMRRLVVRLWSLFVYVIVALVSAYIGIGAAEGLHVGFGWPVNTWRDLFENDTLLIDTVDGKRVEHHEHCGQYGCTEEDHYWIDVGGDEWPVDQATHDVLLRGEVVEIAYRPHTQFVEYVAYGPGLAATRDENELRVSVTLAPIEREVFEQRILPAFTDRTGLQVTIVQMQPDALIDVLESAGGSAFDLLAVDNDQIGQLAHQDLVQDMSEAVRVIPPDVVPSMRALTTVDDRTLFLPFRPNVMITYYDQGQFERLGLAPPQTWDQLLKVARRLDEQGAPLELHGAPGAPSATQLYEFLLQAGGDPFALDSPQSMQAMKFLEQLAPVLASDTEKAKFDTVNSDLAGGKAALAPNWTFGVREVVVEAGRRDIAAHPGWAGPAGAAHVLGGDVLAIPKESERRKPALELAEYLLSQPVQATLATELFWPSMRTDAYQNVQPELRPYWDAINEAMIHAAPRPAVACWHDVEKILSKAWNSIVVKRDSPGELAQHWTAEVREVCERKQAPAPGPPVEPSPTEEAPPGPVIPPFGPPVAGPDDITAGPDGSLWFTNDSNKIGRMTPSGEVTTFEEPNGKIKGLEEITAGPDGNVWFTSYDFDEDDRPVNSMIGRITPSGEIAVFEDRRISEPDGITAGPDGNLWFTSYNRDRIGRITPGGEIAVFDDPEDEIDGPYHIAAGPDGNLWFTSYENDRLGRITPDGEITTFEDEKGRIKGLEGITAGPDGNLWFTSYDNDADGVPFGSVIGRITPRGEISVYDEPDNEFAAPESIVPGPDGNLWFTSYDVNKDGDSINSVLGRITPEGKITILPNQGGTISEPEDMTLGPDANLWFTNHGDNTIGRITPTGEITTFPAG